ncbi:penicillin-binding protein 2 [Salmonella enterica subsp. enterica serovar Heidelberg str. RI-11-014316]|nr:penicillin-binding protein 2 [Salmonella enterica subsp. enterica serovar Heidelberg str. RI-11-014316]
METAGPIKKAWYQGDTISVGIGQGYWIATPIQMVKAMVALINNGKVIAPHLLLNEESGKTVVPYRPSGTPAQIADPASPYWGLVRQAMYGMANAPNGTGYKFFHTAPYGIAAKSGTSQVFSLKENTDLQRENDPHSPARSCVLYRFCTV